MDRVKTSDHFDSGMVTRPAIGDTMEVHGRFHMECIGADGEVKWIEDFDNLVTTLGKNALLDKVLDLASAFSAIHLGLAGSGTKAAADTMASHAGWSEVGGTNAPAYSSTRKVPSFNAASAGSKAMSAASSFAITSNGTVAGAFIVLGGTSAQDNTTGTLYSVGDFSGARAVVNGDTITVTYTGTLT